MILSILILILAVLCGTNHYLVQIKNALEDISISLEDDYVNKAAKIIADTDGE